MAELARKVDHAGLRVNQGAIIVMLVAAFVVNTPWLVAAVAAFMLGGTLAGRPGFLFVYRRLLGPIGLVHPDIRVDNPEPHRFAQGFGGVVTAGGAVALLFGSQILGWILSWLVVALAALNLFAGLCVGCAVYYWMNRLGVAGFIHAPVRAGVNGSALPGAASSGNR